MKVEIRSKVVILLCIVLAVFSSCITDDDDDRGDFALVAGDALPQFSVEMSDGGVLNTQSSGSEVQAYWEKHSFSLPFSAQNDDAVFSLFASHTIPRILITDKEGIIRAVYTDDPLATYQELAKDIDAVLIDKLSGNER